MKYYLLLPASLVLLAGCRTTAPTGEQYDQLAAQLEAVNTNLENIRESVETYNRALELLASSNPNVYGGVRADAITLSKIKLPEKPTEKQVREYLLAIKKASDGQNSFSSSDPQTNMIKNIGTGHLKVVLPLLDGGFHHLRYALPSLVGPDDKELVLQNIEKYPGLAPVAIAQGWGKDGKEKIYNVLERSENIWELKDSIGTLVENDKDRERIINVYINGRYAYDLYPLITTFPKADLADISNRAWERQKFSDSWARMKYAAQAAAFGNVEALGGMINYLSTSQNSLQHMSEGNTLMRLTGKPLDPKSLQEWYDTNKDKLYFDKEADSFKVKEEKK